MKNLPTQFHQKSSRKIFQWVSKWVSFPRNPPLFTGFPETPPQAQEQAATAAPARKQIAVYDSRSPLYERTPYFRTFFNIDWQLKGTINNDIAENREAPNHIGDTLYDPNAKEFVNS